MADQVTIDLADAQGFTMASVAAWDDLDTSRTYRVRLAPLRSQILGTAYAAEYFALTSLAVPMTEWDAHMSAGIGGLAARLRAAPSVRPWVRDMYSASQRSCRWFARDGGLDVARASTPAWSPDAIGSGPAIVRAAGVSPVLVTVGVVGVVAAVSAAIAWWARGRDEAEATASSLKQATATAALAQVAATYAARGEDPPPEITRGLTALARPEPSRASMVPIVAIGAAGLGAGAVAYASATR